MSALGLIKFWLVCKDGNECSKGIQSKSYSVLLKYFLCQQCLLSFNFSKCCHSPLCQAQTTFSFVLTRYLCKFLFIGHFIIILSNMHFNPLTPKISLVILLTVCHVIFMMLVWRTGVGSTKNPLIYSFLYSYLLSTWYCSDIVRRNSVLITHGSYRVNCSALPVGWNYNKTLNIFWHKHLKNYYSTLPYQPQIYFVV